jgi:hypothetical protein
MPDHHVPHVNMLGRSSHQPDSTHELSRIVTDMQHDVYNFCVAE